LVAFLLFEFVIGTLNFKELTGVFNSTKAYKVEVVPLTSFKGSRILPTNTQHNTLLEII
jgi:hypothetical protein